MALNEEGKPMHRFDGGIKAMYKETPRWEDIPRLRELWQGPLVVKGILRPDDARRAVAEGVDAIVVSNHGGNYLDGSMPSIRALPEIVAAVGDEIEVLFDSGVRRGIDVIRALSLGARAVMLGRAYVWAHLAAGEAGVRHMLELFRQQVDDGLAYLGVASLDELEPSLLDIGWATQPASARGLEAGQHGREPLELPERVGAERLHGHVGRARVEVGAHAVGHGLLVAPRDERVDEPVAAAVLEVVVAEAEPPPAVRVVLERKVDGEVIPRGAARRVRVVEQHHALLGSEDLPRPEHRPRLSRCGRA